MAFNTQEFFSHKSSKVSFFSSPVKFGLVLEVDDVDTPERYMAVRIKDISEEVIGIAYPFFVHIGFYPEVGDLLAYVEINGRLWYFPFPVNMSNYLQTTNDNESGVTINRLKRARIRSFPGEYFLNGKGMQALWFDEEGNLFLGKYSDEVSDDLTTSVDEDNSPYGIYGKIDGDQVNLRSYKISFKNESVDEESGGYVLKIRSDALHLLQRERILVAAKKLHLAMQEELIMGAERKVRISTERMYLHGDRVYIGNTDSADENALLGKSFNSFMVKMMRKFAQEFSKMGGPGVPPAVSFAAANLASFCLSAAMEFSTGKYISNTVFLSK